ncbi:MAG: hypothetical protein PHE19_04615 [Candidatus Cloacimonetes bacterium]|nr:hypothetical protein [Candidatus Cloacimonadota bacterium]
MNMRLKLSRQFKLLIAVVIILGAVAFARLNVFKSGSSASGTAFETEREFKKANNYIRTKMIFNVDSMSDFIGLLDRISSKESVSVLKKEQSGSSVVFLAEIQEEDYSQILSEIREYRGAGSKKEDTKKNIDFDADIQQRLDINIKLKNKYLKDLEATKQAYTSDRLRVSLNLVQKTIDSLEVQLKTLSHNKENNLLFLNVGAKPSMIKGVLTSTSNMALKFVIALVGLTIATFVILFVINGILSLMSLLGIRTSKGSGGGKSYGSYKYGSTGRYGGYSYGRYGSNRKRKVKRIYKDPETGEKTEVTSTDNNK